MVKINSGSTIVLATSNENKAKELRELLLPFHITVLNAMEVNLPSVEETGTTFLENSRLKAESGAKHSGLTCISDDSGLEIEALQGRPGVYSARFAKMSGGFDKAMEALYQQAHKAGNLRANFTCVLSVAFPSSTTLSFTGKVYGSLCWPPHYEHGFGYDPFFVPDGYDEPFGALSPQIKQSISHRQKALSQFVQECIINNDT